MAAYVDNESMPSRPLNPVFGTTAYNSNYIENYRTLFSETGKFLQDEGVIITREDYHAGYFITVFDFYSMSPQIKPGNLRLEVQFKTQLTSTITLLAYAEYPDYFQVDQGRSIIYQ